MIIMVNNMKTTTILTLLVFSILANAQNVMTYTDRVYNGDTIVIDTFTCNISKLKTDGKINYNLATKLIEYGKLQMIRNTAANKRALVQVFSSVSGWGASNTQNALIGNYSGLDANQIALFNLYFSSYYFNHKAIDEMEMRLRKELNGNLQIGTIYVGINLKGNKVCGNYLGSITLGEVLQKKGGELVICDHYTVCEATDEEIEKYY